MFLGDGGVKKLITKQGVATQVPEGAFVTSELFSTSWYLSSFSASPLTMGIIV